MKIQLKLTLKDDDGNTVASETGFVNHTEQLSKRKIVQLLMKGVTDWVTLLLKHHSK